jgi:hypothetical protein
LADPARGVVLGCDQQVGRQHVIALGAELGQTRRADLLARIDDKRAVEAKPAAFGDHRLERHHVDQVLRFVVGGAATVPSVALDGKRPRIETPAPLPLEPLDNVAVTVAQHRRQTITLAPYRNEERAAMRDRVGQDLSRIAHALERRRDISLEIDAELWPAPRHLAFGPECHAARQIVAKGARIEIPLGARNCGFTRHWPTGSGCLVHATAMPIARTLHNILSFEIGRIAPGADARRTS